KRAYCLKTQPATGETYPKSDLFNKAHYGLKDRPNRYVSDLKYPERKLLGVNPSDKELIEEIIYKVCFLR
ncbi:hypothetical protein ACOY50_23725, partial [Enterobacter asburiae]